MSVSYALLGLLEQRSSYGYDLKRAYDQHLGATKPLPFGQVYSTLGRLERDRKVKAAGVESGEGPERRRYAITRTGVTDLERWLREPEQPEPHLQTVLFSKVVLALLSDRSAHDYLDAQRAAHLQRMRELTVRRRSAPLSQALLADHALFHLEADLRWIDQTTARLEDLRREVSE